MSRKMPAPAPRAQRGGARETIFALSTAPGRAGIAVVRLSGAAAGQAVEALTGKPPPAPRQAKLARFRDPESGALLDQGLLLWFRGPASETGEDMAELQLHGSPAVVEAVLAALARLPGLRLAEPGEFARRAFESGKLDLSQVEGLADLIEAQTEAQRRQALRQMDGALTAATEDWRGRVLHALAWLEAAIDFPEEDVPSGLPDQAARQAAGLAGEIADALADGQRGERLRAGFQVAIVGPPNVGKSSILNRIAKRDAAIVAPGAGTTRDVIEVHLDLGGYPVNLADTAGLRALAEGEETAVEAEGMRRSRDRAAAADLRLAVFDLRDWPALEPEALALVDAGTVVLLNKADLAPDKVIPEAERLPPSERPVHVVSAKTGQGLDRLLATLEEAATAGLGVAGTGAAVTRLRHRQALEDCRAALARAAESAAPELAAEDLRLAARALGRIAGRVDVEDLLDVIFREFCIGK